MPTFREVHELDGLRLAVELKPINLAVGRAIWNRFGDIRTSAVNVHLRFPFAVVGGVLVVPTFEVIGTKEALKAKEQGQASTGGGRPPQSEAADAETRHTRGDSGQKNLRFL